MSIEKIINDYFPAFYEYKVDPKVKERCMYFHLVPLGDSGLCLGTLTAFDDNGQRSWKTFSKKSFRDFMKGFEQILKKYQNNTDYLGKMYGWTAREVNTYVRSFIKHKNVMRFFLIDRKDAGKFVREYQNHYYLKDYDVPVEFAIELKSIPTN